MWRASFSLTAVFLVTLSGMPAGAQFYGSDAYTEYRLLEPESHSFRIIYFVTETKVGSPYHFNGVRKGSVHSDVEVFDVATGQETRFEEVHGKDVIEAGVPGDFDAEMEYIQVHLRRKVEERTEARVRIDKTYRDQKSYFRDGDAIVFDRRLGIGRNSIVLPEGYALVSSSVAAQVIPRADGRLAVSFANINTYGAEVRIAARPAVKKFSTEVVVEERAFDATETLYDLEEPSTHRFQIIHDFTAHEPGKQVPLEILEREPIEKLVASDLDLGRELEVVKDGSTRHAVVTSPRASVRLRLRGAVTDPGYRAENGELVWERRLAGLNNTVILPRGWELSVLTTPGLVSAREDGRVQVHFVNPSPGEMAAALRARRK